MRSDFETLLREIGLMAADAGLSPPLFLKALRRDLRSSPNPVRALNNLHRFLNTGFASSLLRDFSNQPVLRRMGIELFAHSQFLADILVRHSELFHWLTSAGNLKTPRSARELTEEAERTVSLFSRTEKKLDSLKRFQRREQLRIGARQILGEADIAVTSVELAALADAILSMVLKIGFGDLTRTEAETLHNELAIIALGKLGGNELNFSSDIDLMFVYEEDHELDLPSMRIGSAHEFYNRLSEFIVRKLTEHTAEGHLYRVDMRLRPDGQSGPLAMSRKAYVTYYETRGELWERQMLIKARVAAGNLSVGEKWLVDIQPFVYPRTLLGSPLEEIARIRQRIERELKVDTNVKLGTGGIRDIEFIVQALQLLNGGQTELVRERNTLAAIERLTQVSYLTPRERNRLVDAYRFLRTVEDRLQLLHGLRRHTLPSSPEEKHILARQLGYGTASRFEAVLARHRRNVRRIAASVFSARGAKTKGEFSEARPQEAARLVDRSFGSLPPAQRRHIASRMSVIAKDVPDLAARLPLTLQLMRKHRAPVWCATTLPVLTGARPLRRTIAQAATNDKMLSLLTLVCSRSSRLVHLLAREPLLFESLAGRPEEVLAQERGWSFLRESDPLRYKLYNEFKVVLRLLLGRIAIREATEELSALADEMIARALDHAVEETHFSPSMPRIAVLALGKLGGREITIGSDLDLLFVYEGGDDPSKAAPAQELTQRFVGWFHSETEKVYEIDLRLRPEGKSSPPATEFTYYREYLKHRASLWERQALTRVRFVAGDETFGREVLKSLEDFTFGSPLPPSWVRELKAMRRRMMEERERRERGLDLKLTKGGLADLEYSIQALQLRFGGERLMMRTPSSFEAAARVRRERFMGFGKIGHLLQNLSYLRTLETFVRLNGETAGSVLPHDRARLECLAAAMGEHSVAVFRRKLRSVLNQNHQFLRHLFRTIR